MTVSENNQKLNSLTVSVPGRIHVKIRVAAAALRPAAIHKISCQEPLYKVFSDQQTAGRTEGPLEERAGARCVRFYTQGSVVC